MGTTNDKAIVKTNTGLSWSAADIARYGVSDWSTIRDRIAPQGTPKDAADVVGETFTVLRMRPYKSRYEGERDIVYWIVGLTEQGELFNTTLGGLAVCDVLDAVFALQGEYAAALQAEDKIKIRDLEELGASKPFKFKLGWVVVGNQGYYIFE